MERIMKRTLIIFILIASFLFSAHLFGDPAKVKPVIAVIDFEAKRTVSNDLSSTITDYFRTQLFNINKVILVNREDMGKILEEQNFQMSGCTSTECAVQIGQILGASKIILGSLGKVGNIYLLNTKLIDVETGEILEAKSQKAENQENLLIAVERLVQIMFDFTPYQKREIETKQTQVRNGLTYCLNEINPYIGIVIFRYDNGNIESKANVVDGIMNGEQIFYNKNGKTEAKINNKDGKLDGEQIFYYENGTIEVIKYFKDDEFNGEWIYYSEDGKTESKINYKDGKLDGEQIFYYEGGKIESKTYCKDGKPDGEQVVFYKNGTIKTKRNYKDGELNGEEIHYSEDGKVESKRNYKDDN